MRNRRYISLDPSYPPPALEAASIRVVEGARRSLRSILRATGAPKRREGLKVGFRLPTKEEEEELEEASNRRTARGSTPLPTQRS